MSKYRWEEQIREYMDNWGSYTYTRATLFVNNEKIAEICKDLTDVLGKSLNDTKYEMWIGDTKYVFSIDLEESKRQCVETHLQRLNKELKDITTTIKNFEGALKK